MALMPYLVCWKKKPPSGPIIFFWLQCLIYYVCKMVIRIQKKQLPKQNVVMDRLKNGCSCWSNSWFNG